MTSALPQAASDHRKPSTGLRTGAQYLADDPQRRSPGHLRRRGGQGRNLPSRLRGAARSIAGLWDIAADPANRELMTYPSPKTGKPVLWCYHVPQTAGRPPSAAPHDPALDRAHLRPDGSHARSRRRVLRGLRRQPGFFATAGQRYADNLIAFYEYARDNHLYISYALAPPQIDRSKPSHAAVRPDAVRRASSPSATAGSCSRARSSLRPARRSPTICS